MSRDYVYNSRDYELYCGREIFKDFVRMLSLVLKEIVRMLSHLAASRKYNYGRSFKY